MPELDRQFWKIDENLMRVELTELERADHLARRKDIYIARHPETRHGGDRSSRQNGDLAATDRFTADTEKKTGLDERTIHGAARCPLLDDLALWAIHLLRERSVHSWLMHDFERRNPNYLSIKERSHSNESGLLDNKILYYYGKMKRDKGY